jgi:hypothetical protein
MTPRLLRVVLFAASLCLPGKLLADAGVFTGNGQSLHQITSKNIHLVSIDVLIIPGRGPFLFDGGVAGMDVAQYQCKFVLANLSDKPEEVQIGFPIDSQFAEEDQAKTDEKKAAISGEWVNEYGFIARDSTATYNVDFVHRTPQKGPGEFSSLFVWKMNFEAKQTRTLTVTYHIPISFGLTSTEKNPEDMGSWSDDFAPEQFDLAMMERIGYITSTGSSWAGNVEKATFTVITDPFENYLKERGVFEGSSEDQAASSKDSPNPFPARHPWWYRKVDTAGGKPIKGGLQWSYTDYKPADPIIVSYYFTNFPQRPEEADAYLDQFLAELRPPQQRDAMLTRLRDILFATYGKAPADPKTLAFVKQQSWYEPRKDFSDSSLATQQKAILAKVEQRKRQ